MTDKPWYQIGPEVKERSFGKEPRRVTPIGAAQDEPVGIYLGSEAMDLIEQAMAATPEQPVTGLLLGHPLKSARRPFLLVTRAIISPVPPKDNEELLFSPAALQAMEEIWRQTSPRSIVVGWFHGRPGRGNAPMSTYERFTHERFFTAPWQIALLIDTRQKSSTLYQWHAESLLPCDAFYFWNSAKEPLSALLESQELPTEIVLQTAVTAESTPSDAPHTPPSVLRKRLWIAAPILLLVYLLIPGAPGSLAWIQARYAEREQELVQLEQSLVELELEATSLGAFSETPAPGNLVEGGDSAPPSDSELQAAETPVERENGQPTASNTTQPVNPEPSVSNGGSVESNAAAQTEQQASRAPGTTVADAEQEYIIREGDTMWRISTDLLGDPASYRSLAEENDIEDPDRIFPGQRIRLPE